MKLSEIRSIMATLLYHYCNSVCSCESGILAKGRHNTDCFAHYKSPLVLRVSRAIAALDRMATK